MSTASSLTTKMILVVSLAFAATACAVEPTEGDEADGPARSESQAQAKGGGGTTGGACSVISGANKGKTGTFNADGDCEGSWGLSECKNQDGTDSGKCKAGAAVIIRPLPIYGTRVGALAP